MKTTKLTVLLALACPLLVSAADAPPLEDRMKQLETQLKDLARQNDDMRKQLGWSGTNAPVFVKPTSKLQKINIGGLIQANAEYGGEPDSRYAGIKDRFLIRRARISITGAFLENFDFRLESDFGANTLAESTGYRAQITDAYINWSKYNFANVKAGQFKVPFGYEQLVSDPKLLTIERSLPNDRLTDGRQIGMAVSGDYFEKRLGYSVGVFNGTSVNTSANDNDEFLIAGRIYGVPLQTTWGKQDVKLSLGLNALSTDDNGVSKGGYAFDLVPGGAVDNLFSGGREAYGADLQFNVGPFGLCAEYLRAQFHPLNRIPTTTLDADGWYVMGTYFILPKKLQGLVKYESFDPNTDKKGDTTDVWTFGLNYLIKGDDIKLSVNYLLGNYNTPSMIQEDWRGRLLTRLQVAF